MKISKPMTHQRAALSLPAGVFRRLLIHSLLWCLLSVLVAFNKYSELQQQGNPREFLSLAIEWLLAAPGFIGLSVTLQTVYQARPEFATQAKYIASGFIILSTVYLPVEIVYCSVINLLTTEHAVSVQSLLRDLATIHKFRWFSDLVLITLVYLSTIGYSVWRQNQLHQTAWQETLKDNLQLQLLLEQQRLIVLRAQLEPHFIFNTLSAISALVRLDDKPLAIGGINRLSNLLRYALDASNRDWVSFDEELVFIQDYLTLQGLRFGERLKFSIKGNDASVLQAECLPLLIQTLIENALRHDLECHTDSSLIELEFEHDAQQLRFRLRNSLKPLRKKNSGFGIGLSHSKERLQLAYGDLATLNTTQGADYFCVEVSQPLYGV